jgi:hypothetical protein
VTVPTVERGLRLVEDVQRPPRRDLAELLRQLDPLSLAARERGRRLPELDVVEPHVVQGLEPAPELRDLGEEAQRLLDRHVEHVGDRLALEAHLEGLAVVALAAARLARHVDVRQEVHLDLDRPVALAGFAASAAHVEREASGLVAAHLRLRRERVELTNRREDVGIGGRVGSRRAADRRLVDVDHLVEAFDPLDRVVLAGLDPHPVEPVREGLVDDLVHERGLAGARDARDADELGDRELDVDVLQVVHPRAAHGEGAVVVRAPVGNRDLALPREELAGDRLRVSFDRLRRALCDDVAAVHAGAGAHVHEVVGRAHHLLVVLHDQHGVAEVAQPLERPDQLAVVPLVEADRGLVEDVEHADELAPDLRREP